MQRVLRDTCLTGITTEQCFFDDLHGVGARREDDVHRDARAANGCSKPHELLLEYAVSIGELVRAILSRVTNGRSFVGPVRLVVTPVNYRNRKS